MYKKLLVAVIFFNLFFISDVFAKIEFKEMEHDVITIVNGRNISTEELEKALINSGKHVKGIKIEKGRALNSVYLRAIIDSYLVVIDAISKGYDKSFDFKYLKKDAMESSILNAYIEKEISNKINEDNKEKKAELLSESIFTIINDNKKNYKIDINKKYLNGISKDSDWYDVVVKVGDFEILLGDLIKKLTSSYYESMNPEVISSKSIEEAMDSLIKRAVLINEAKKLGYDKGIPELTSEEEKNILKEVHKIKESELITITDEEMKKMYEANKRYYSERLHLKKYAFIQKGTEEDINKIKDRLDNGEDFLKIVETEPENKEKSEFSGIIEYTQRINPVIEDVFDKLKDGEISNTIKSKDERYVIIKRIDVLFDSYDEVVPIVNDDIRKEKYSIIMQTKIKELRDNADIIVNSNIVSKEEFFPRKEIVTQENKNK